jgi:hypothetical protein
MVVVQSQTLAQVEVTSTIDLNGVANAQFQIRIQKQTQPNDLANK